MTARDIFDQTINPLFEAHRAEWLTEARATARRLGQGGRAVTVNDVRELCPPPLGVDPRVMGSVFKRSEWRRVGYVNSNRATCHGRLIAAFVKIVAE